MQDAPDVDWEDRIGAYSQEDLDQFSEQHRDARVLTVKSLNRMQICRILDPRLSNAYRAGVHFPADLVNDSAPPLAMLSELHSVRLNSQTYLSSHVSKHSGWLPRRQNATNGTGSLNQGATFDVLGV